MTDIIKKKSYKFRLIIYYSHEDGSYIVGVPELPGCMADGKTLAEAAGNVQKVISVWLESAGEDGRIPNFYADPDDIPIGYFLEMDPYWHIRFMSYRNCDFEGLDYRAVSDYAHERNIPVAELTKEEMLSVSKAK